VGVGVGVGVGEGGSGDPDGASEGSEDEVADEAFDLTDGTGDWGEVARELLSGFIEELIAEDMLVLAEREEVTPDELKVLLENTR
jgi:hypothetical protein